MTMICHLKQFPRVETQRENVFERVDVLKERPDAQLTGEVLCRVFTPFSVVLFSVIVLVLTDANSGQRSWKLTSGGSKLRGSS